MGKIKQRIASALVALGVVGGGMVAFAAPAQAYSTWEKQVVRCDYIDVYRHYDFDWWEEVFQGKRDYDQYLYTYYKYNPPCHYVYRF